MLAEQCRKRFADAIAAGRMTVANVGVLEKPGTFTFYRNLTDSGWSSFEPVMGKKQGKWEEIDIQCYTTRQLIEEHGRPYFMKVDIEGVDLQTLASLSPGDCPKYVSLELNDTDPIIERLVDLGYSAFKFVDGETYWPSTPIFEHQIGWRFLRKAGNRIPFIKDVIKSLPQRVRQKSEWNPAGKHNPDGYPFTDYNSGPFGERAAGEWMSPDSALRWLKRLRRDYLKAGLANKMWWDVHARHE